MSQHSEPEDVTVFTGGIDPEIAQFVRELQGDFSRHPNMSALPFPQQRALAEVARKRWTLGGPTMARREDFAFSGPQGEVRLRLISPHALLPQPGASAPPALIYLHGGGFTTFSLNTHERVMREYAAGFGGVVLGVDYSLSPEAKFPVALHETVAAVEWIRREAGALGVDPERLAIGGDSAGANLAVSTCLKLRDDGRGGIVMAMVLNYGFFGVDFDGESSRRHGGSGNMLTNEELAAFADNYVGGTPYGADPLAWPILAELHDLPPSYHVVAECDPLADADLQMVDKLRAAGNDATSTVYRGATHSFLEAVSISRVARRAFQDTCGWLADRLGAVGAVG